MIRSLKCDKLDLENWMLRDVMGNEKLATKTLGIFLIIDQL